MDVFISWSGERSRAAAEALRGWLPKIINALKPWLSSEDIDKGARWGTDVASRLEAAKASIICLTHSNLHSDWILFEAGALSKTLQNTFVCPFLIDLEPSDVKPPLSQFQATKAQKQDVLKLLKTLNSALAADALLESHIDEAFEVWWPKLDLQLKHLPTDESRNPPSRSERDILEEILALVRNQNRIPRRPIRPSISRESEMILETLMQIAKRIDPSLRTISPMAHPTDYLFRLVSDEIEYDISIPGNTPLDDIERVVISQMPREILKRAGVYLAEPEPAQAVAKAAEKPTAN